MKVIGIRRAVTASLLFYLSPGFLPPCRTFDDAVECAANKNTKCVQYVVLLMHNVARIKVAAIAGGGGSVVTESAVVLCPLCGGADL